jgi:hypothetical protein
VPAANEADFIYHGDAAAGGKELADFIVATVKESGADHVRLPLLSERQMTWLRDRLTARMTDWLWNGALTSIAPLATGNMRQTSRLRRSIARAERDGLIFACGPYMDPQEVQTLHTKRWGEANRPKKFFHMLEALLSSGCAEFITLRSSDGNLIAGQLDILGSASRHFYYSVADTDLRKGCGTAVLGMSWRSFAADHRQNMYSFGRGAERYKYQYATGYRELFELRGFFAPV